MIKENQKLLNLIHLIIDALIIVASFIMAYYLRFNVKYSPLIKLHIIKEPFGYYFPMSKYMEMLLFLIPFYIIAYFGEILVSYLFYAFLIWKITPLLG